MARVAMSTFCLSAGLLVCAGWIASVLNKAICRGEGIRAGAAVLLGREPEEERKLSASWMAVMSEKKT